MLFHLSIDAQHPERVARALARLMGGRALPFPAVAEGSWVAHAGDASNTLVEVYPAGTRLFESPEGAIGAPSGAGRRTATHFALATNLAEEEVHALARDQGWPSETHSRKGLFRVIEVWIEGTTLAELLTPAMQAEYLATTRLDLWEQMLAEPA
jgi:hypothetical protein